MTEPSFSVDAHGVISFQHAAFRGAQSLAGAGVASAVDAHGVIYFEPVTSGGTRDLAGLVSANAYDDVYVADLDSVPVTTAALVSPTYQVDPDSEDPTATTMLRNVELQNVLAHISVRETQDEYLCV